MVIVDYKQAIHNISVPFLSGPPMRESMFLHFPVFRVQALIGLLCLQSQRYNLILIQLLPILLSDQTHRMLLHVLISYRYMEPTSIGQYNLLLSRSSIWLNVPS